MDRQTELIIQFLMDRHSEAEKNRVLMDRQTEADYQVFDGQTD